MTTPKYMVLEASTQSGLAWVPWIRSRRLGWAAPTSPKSPRAPPYRNPSELGFGILRQGAPHPDRERNRSRQEGICTRSGNQVYLGKPSMASGFSHKSVIESSSLDLPDVQLNINWEDVICPICLDFPHNGVLLQCSSYDKGCRPFMCDTDHTHSNCLDRFKSASGLPADTKVSSTVTGTSAVSVRALPSETGSCPMCPLCRGEVTGWIVIDEARAYLDTKKRCCQEKQCSYVGNHMELQLHAKQEHPHARPSEIDPAQQLDWENFQHSSEIIDVLSTIHSEVPHGVVLGDYVIEYGDSRGDEYEDFPGDDGNWWTSCILYNVFDNLRTSRNRRRSRASETRRNHRRSNFDVSSMDDASTSSADNLEYQFDDSDDEFGGAVGVASMERAYRRSYRRRRSRFQDS